MIEIIMTVVVGSGAFVILAYIAKKLFE